MAAHGGAGERARSSVRRLPLALALLLAACEREPAQPPTDAPPPLQFERASVDNVRHGERLGRVLGCTGCHGADLTGHAWIEDPQVALLYTSNLTRAVPLYSDAELDRAIRFGARADGSPLWEMPSELFTQLADADMAALIAWLRTVPPKGEPHPRVRIGPEGRRAIASGEVRPAPELVRASRDSGPPGAAPGDGWARYMIRATCAECHSLDLTGGDSTPDLIVVGGYSREQFRHLLRTGEPIGGRVLTLMAGASRGRFVHLTDREVDAIYDYLSARARQPQ